jgi:hypothetical protein
MKRPIASIAGAAAALTLAACSTTSTGSVGEAPSSSTAVAVPEGPDATAAGSIPILITAGDRTFTASLNDNAAARDLAESLPMTLPASRVGGIEYMVELDEPLTETGPFYRTVEAGDIVYWNPRDSVTVIFAPTSPVGELTKLGEVTSDLGGFRDLPANVDLRIERA